MASKARTTTLLGGFEAISGLDFRKSLLSSGREMMQHALNVREIRRSDENGVVTSVTIAADCIREMSLTEKPWTVTLELRPDDRVVTLARCSCTAGIDGLCKHTSAIYQFVNCERSEGCTDSNQVWSKPSEKLNDLYPKGSSIQELFFNKSPAKRDFSGKNFDVDHVVKLMEKHSLQNSSVYKTLTVDTTSVEIDPAPKLPTINQQIQELLLKPLSRPHPDQNHCQSLSKDHQTFYEENLLTPAKDPGTIFCETIGQSQNSKWFSHRKFRVTASIARKIAKGTRKDLRVKYFLENLRPTRGMNYGKDMEPIAREQYKVLFKKEVDEAGLIVNPDLPWLGASVDGLVFEEDGTCTVLEIKCPSSCEDDQIDVDYIVNGQLKKSHSYYAQVQLQMLLCHSEMCHLFVFSLADHLLVEVPFDKEFT